MIKCVCISDTHGQTPRVGQGDVLIHAGDLTNKGEIEEIEKGLKWLSSLEADLKILVPGNHDWGFQLEPKKTREMCEHHGIVLLIDEELFYGGKLFYGSPWQPTFGKWAFNLDSPGPIKDKWDRIPHDLDVLITHGPAYGILDGTLWGREHVGCRELRAAILDTKPRVHVFGHTHMQNGVMSVSLGGYSYLAVNASLSDERYVCQNPSQIVWI
jgi:Icc-related predicted phosphoesterase